MLINENWEPKVADFGLTKAALADMYKAGNTNTNEAHTMDNVNPRWLAQEIIKAEPATAASDVFALAVVLWELLTFRIPWEGMGSTSIASELFQGKRLPMPDIKDVPGEDTKHHHGMLTLKLYKPAVKKNEYISFWSF